MCTREHTFLLLQTLVNQATVTHNRHPQPSPIHNLDLNTKASTHTMHHLKMLFITLLFSVLAVSGWEIAFWSGEECEGDSSTYSGSGGDLSQCLQPGQPGEGCQWQADGGTEECTTVTQPMPGSFRYTEGSHCCVQKDVLMDCTHKECKIPGAGHCWPTSYLPFFTDKINYLTFTCSDDSGEDKKRAVNATSSGVLFHA